VKVALASGTTERSDHDKRYISAATITALILGAVTWIAPSYLVDLWLDGESEAGVIPIVDTIGTSVVLFTSVAGVVEVLGTSGIGIALGNWIARNASSDEEIYHALRTVEKFVLGIIGLLVILVGVWAVFGGPSVFGPLSVPIITGFLVFIGTIAGAAINRFGLLGNDKQIVSDTDSQSPSVDTNTQ